MKMTMILGFLVFSVALAVAQDEKKEEPGKAIFQSNKCQSCHSIEAVGIKKKPNQKPPDLSTVGSSRTAEFIKAYLKKKESINEVKHAIAFKGSDEDFQVLLEWLASLKAQEK